MECQIIQTDKISEENKAERNILQFLSFCDANYTIYRELQITNTYKERLKGYDKKQPDFVVVSTKVGVVSIEVKDWNLEDNQYIWKDQYYLEVISRDGRKWSVNNPVSQANDYQYALIELLKDIDVFVSSILAFPFITKADFLNRLSNIDILRNPQSRYFLDLDRVIFKEHIDQNYTKPGFLLQKFVQEHPKFKRSNEQQIDNINKRLLPSTFKIGDFSDRQKNKSHLKIISERQQKWIFNLDPRKNYLLDVAGSGKTNSILSKAIYLVDQKHSHESIRILITTYSENLENNIRRIFNHKIALSPDQSIYQEAITIQCIPNLIKNMICKILQINTIEQYVDANITGDEQERQMLADVLEHLISDSEDFRLFDVVMVDEIQDFSDEYLLLVSYLNKSDKYFFVGDVGQKIFDRDHNLKLIGFEPNTVDLAKSYKMYRTPKYIGKLATRFLIKDPESKNELRDKGYTQKFKPANDSDELAIIMKTPQPIISVLKRIQGLLKSSFLPEDIMVISSSTKLLNIHDCLMENQIPVLRNEPDKSLNEVVLVDFENVKGLEKNVVIICGIEDLYCQGCPESTFDKNPEQKKKELFSRRMIYVALTRTLEKLFIYYEGGTNRFISDLTQINQQLMKDLQGYQYEL